MCKWLSPADIAERFGCSMPTARKRMRQMEHMEKPLLVEEWAVQEYENARMVFPMNAPRRPKIKTHRNQTGGLIPYRK